MLFATRVRSTTGGYVFSLFTSGRGVHHLHPIILPLAHVLSGGTPSASHNTSTGPMSFLGGTPVTGHRSLSWGTPDPGGGTILLAFVPQNEVPTGQIRMGCTPTQVRMGYPPQQNSGTPWNRLCSDRLCCVYLSFCLSKGGGDIPTRTGTRYQTPWPGPVEGTPCPTPTLPQPPPLRSQDQDRVPQTHPPQDRKCHRQDRARVGRLLCFQRSTFLCWNANVLGFNKNKENCQLVS